ncbi:isochorismatase domain-containing protein 1-like isoform X2 [Haliotis rufescens]|uniref:isochorismatase domain-containing protein 1-like isoform X2 n=1 Tax=Haliotis rufescens TaxID=6454 RepID=UPI001EAFA8A5|nr:isochorismatase domain-containing protein 1-like isoform X2 [Haliotis rufescens]
MSEKRLGDLRLDQTVFFCCDMQEKFRPAIKHFADILQIAQRLVKASKILNIPLIVTEQYPKGLGATVSELDAAHAVGVFPKTRFTMLLPEVEEKLQSISNVKHVVLFGIERFRQSGAIVTTSEAVLLQLVGDKEHPHFKEIQSLIRELGPESGLGCNL